MQKRPGGFGDFNKQIGNDIKMVNEEGWRVTWHLRENLSPTQMRLLTQYKNETGGRFDFEVGP